MFPDGPILSIILCFLLNIVSIDTLHSINAVKSDLVSIIQKSEEAAVSIHSSIYLKSLCNVNNSIWFFARTTSKYGMYYIWEMEDDGRILCEQMQNSVVIEKLTQLWIQSSTIFSSSFAVILRFFVIGILVLLLFIVQCYRKRPSKNHPNSMFSTFSRSKVYWQCLLNSAKVWV